ESDEPIGSAGNKPQRGLCPPPAVPVVMIGPRFQEAYEKGMGLIYRLLSIGTQLREKSDRGIESLPIL
ncbi:MAG: hypothetical protein Q4G07_06085, partial [Oscillospiraceae bacterium]|nr:hypothetical protein [Oscillospiraceae bacterium]